MSRSKQKGTAWESQIVEYLREQGFPTVERRTLNGAKDRGDIAGLPGVVIEAKNAKTMALSQWMKETEQEQANDAADLAALWVKRRGKGSAGDAYVVMTGEQFTRLLSMWTATDEGAG